MKNILIILLVIPVSFFPLLLFYSTYDYSNKKIMSFSEYRLSEKDISLIQDGDIILRHGYGYVSDMIADTKNEKYKISHCAIISKDSLTGKINVIHSVSQTLAEFDGIQSQPLEIFLNDCKKNSVIISRYKHNKKIPASEISERAKYYLKQKIPFDYKFDLFDHQKIYCTELIYMIIKDVFNDDIFLYSSNKNPKDIDFSVFTDTTHFEVVLNHNLRTN